MDTEGLTEEVVDVEDTGLLSLAERACADSLALQFVFNLVASSTYKHIQFC